jgi:hypothetical protein
MNADHIVEEVRKIRENQAEKLNFDIKAIISAAQKKQKKSANTLVSMRSREARLTSRSS